MEEKVVNSILKDLRNLPEKLLLADKIKTALKLPDIDLPRKNFLNWLLTGKYIPGILSDQEVLRYVQFQGKIRENHIIDKILQLIDQYHKDSYLYEERLITKKLFADLEKNPQYQPLLVIAVQSQKLLAQQSDTFLKQEADFINWLSGEPSDRYWLYAREYSKHPEIAVESIIERLKPPSSDKHYDALFNILSGMSSDQIKQMPELLVFLSHVDTRFAKFLEAYNVPEAPEVPSII